MLKKSRYNFEIDKLHNGNILIFNSLTSAFGIMDKKVQDIYYNIENVNEDNEADNEIKKSISTMKNNGFIVDQEIDEIELFKVRNKLTRFGSTQVLTIGVAPTMICNMECPYCYEDKTNVIMNEETCRNLVNFIKTSILNRNLKRISMQWYGGEPLLAKEIIRELSKQLIGICNELNVQYSAAIVTNGYLLDVDTAKMLRDECKVISAQITIDGLKETHNQRRKLKDGKDSFDRIINNINECKEIIKITVRTNVDRTNSDEVKQLIKFMAQDKKWAGKVCAYIHPVFNRENDSFQMNAGDCFTEEEYSKVDAMLYEEGFKYSSAPMLTTALYPQARFSFCGAVGSSSLMIDSNGEIYSCWNTINNKKNSVGNVKDGLLLNKNYLDWLSLELPEKCLECNVLPLCNGGCPYEIIVKGRQPSCHHVALNFRERLKLMYKLYRLQHVTNA